MAALALAHLALIGLTVGLVIALTPLLTAWGATAVVVGLLALGAVLLAGKARKWFRNLANAYREASR